MSRARIALLLAGTLSAGCVPTNFVMPTTAGDKKPTAAEKKPAAADQAARKPVRAPVTAVQVNASNARDKATELREEMENDLLTHIEAQDK
jgi:hypothetical protein